MDVDLPVFKGGRVPVHLLKNRPEEIPGHFPRGLEHHLKHGFTVFPVIFMCRQRFNIK